MLGSIWRRAVVGKVIPEREIERRCREMGRRSILVRSSTPETGAGPPRRRSTPYFRTAHSVARFEVAPCVGDDLSPGRMIRCLDADDPGYKVSVFLVHERDEFVLR
jgi:hypothetical protein